MKQALSRLWRFLADLVSATAADDRDEACSPGYDPADDARRSYDAAVSAKKARGDTHWPARRLRPVDPETERQMAALKRALDERLEGGGHGH